MASAMATVRDFVLKTTRRKGLNEEELEGGWGLGWVAFDVEKHVS